MLQRAGAKTGQFRRIQACVEKGGARASRFFVCAVARSKILCWCSCYAVCRLSWSSKRVCVCVCVCVKGVLPFHHCNIGTCEHMFNYIPGVDFVSPINMLIRRGLCLAAIHFWHVSMYMTSTLAMVWPSTLNYLEAGRLLVRLLLLAWA